MGATTLVTDEGRGYLAYARLSEAPDTNGDVGDHDRSEQEDRDDETPDQGNQRRRGGMSGATRTIPVPVVGGSPVTVAGQFPFTEAAWTQFMAVLQAMKPGLVTDEEPDAPKDPDKDEPVSLAPLDPEKAPRALLAVKPGDSPEPQDDEQGDTAAAHGEADGEDDPAR